MAQEAKLAGFEQAIRDRIRGDVIFDEVGRGIYATDASIYQIMPVAVVLPRDEADVCAAVQTAAEHSVGILPRGGGTSLGGQATGASMVIDFSKYMSNILELNVQEQWVRVQPGLVLDELNAALAEHGLGFAPDPATSSRATIGGMMGNNSAGLANPEACRSASGAARFKRSDYARRSSLRTVAGRRRYRVRPRQR